MKMEISEKKCTLLRTHTDYEIFVHFLDSQEVSLWAPCSNSVFLISLTTQAEEGHAYKQQFAWLASLPRGYVVRMSSRAEDSTTQRAGRRQSRHGNTSRDKRRKTPLLSLYPSLCGG